MFRHAIVRDTAYDMLGEDDRRLGHRLAARWLERAGEHDALTLAEHFERGGDSDRAARHLARAAHHAMAAHDIESAGRRVRRGLDLTGTDEVGALLHAIGAEVERWRGAHEAARAHALTAMEALERGSAEWMRAASEAIAACARLGDYDRAELIALGVEGVRANDAAIASHQVSALCLAARQLFHAGRYASAQMRMTAARRLAVERSLDPVAEAELHRVEAARARQFGDPKGDADGYAAALACYERAGDARRACNTRVSLGFACAELGELETAEAQLRRALADAERMGLDAIAARAHHNLGMVLCEAGPARGGPRDRAARRRRERAERRPAARGRLAHVHVGDRARDGRRRGRGAGGGGGVRGLRRDAARPRRRAGRARSGARGGRPRGGGDRARRRGGWRSSASSAGSRSTRR